MTAHRARLTETDIRRLVKAVDDDDRAEAAHKLCRSMERAQLDGDERAAAEKKRRDDEEKAAKPTAMPNKPAGQRAA